MINKILDWIYPPRCMICLSIIPLYEEKWICKYCKDSLVALTLINCIKCGRPVEYIGMTCNECKKKELSFVKNYAVYPYDEVMSTIIKNFKYGNHPQYSKGLGCLMEDYYKKHFFEKIDFIIPVPMYAKKEKERGFNQAKLLAKELAKLVKVECIEDLIIRTKNTKAQNLLNASERKNNMENAFKLNKKYQVNAKSFLIIDDIYTTGSTIDACSKVLLLSGAKSVFGFTLSIAIRKL